MKIDQGGEQGLFIDFHELNALYKKGALKALPNYQEIQSKYPQLIAKNIDSDYGRKIFISHRWDDPVPDSHPDPRGWQLEALCTYGEELKISENEPACFWYDFCSLPQKPRTSAEDVIFKKGLNHIQRLCQNCDIVALISNTKGNAADNIDEMLRRGWILTELFVGSKHERVGMALFENTSYVTFAKANRLGWENIIPDLAGMMPYDNEDAVHEWLVHNGIACTNGADLKLLAKILHDEISGINPGVTPPLKLAFDKTVVLDSAQIAVYGIDKNGLSGHFPDTYFEYNYAPDRFAVTPRHRPALGKLGQTQSLTQSQFDELRIDPANGRSPMYPGIRFDWQAAAHTPGIIEVKPGLLPPAP